MQNNLEAVLQVMKFIYDNIIYAELNTKSDYCQVCGWDGEIQIAEENGKLIWKVPPVRQYGPGQDERGPPDLRLHRDPVLEPGPDPGNPGPGAALIRTPSLFIESHRCLRSRRRYGTNGRRHL